MSNTNHSVNVQPEATSRMSGIALALGILSLPGSLLAWDTLPGGGFVWGLPLAVAAVIVGVQAVRQRVGSRSRDHRHRPRRRDDRHDGRLDGRRRGLMSVLAKIGLVAGAFVVLAARLVLVPYWDEADVLHPRGRRRSRLAPISVPRW